MGYCVLWPVSIRQGEEQGKSSVHQQGNGYERGMSGEDWLERNGGGGGS